MNKKRPTEKELKRMYWQEGKLLREIAEEYSVRVPSVIKWFRKYQIERRNKSTSNLKRWNKKHPSKDELEGLYLEEGLSTIALAERYNVRHPTISNWLEKFGIKRRDNSEAHLGFTKPSREELNRLKIEEKLTTSEMAERYKVNPATVVRWMRRDGIKIKQPSVKLGQWKDLEFTLEQAKKFLEENPEYSELPGMRTLLQKRYLSLGSSINKYHGGLPNFRQRLNEYLGRETEESTSLLERYIGGTQND